MWVDVRIVGMDMGFNVECRVLSECNGVSVTVGVIVRIGASRCTGVGVSVDMDASVGVSANYYVEDIECKSAGRVLKFSLDTLLSGTQAFRGTTGLAIVPDGSVKTTASLLAPAIDSISQTRAFSATGG